MGHHLRSDGTVDTSSFKIVYVAPMKALVAEMVGNFSQRLKKYGMQVGPSARTPCRNLRSQSPIWLGCSSLQEHCNLTAIPHTGSNLHLRDMRYMSTLSSQLLYL